jgi:elongator complex protein 1
VPRLRILRKKKAEDPGAFLNTSHLTSENYFEGNANDVDAPDDISVVATEASTSASLFTRYTPQSAGSRATRTSSRNRRREERKRARGKKGTIYEEEYLVNSIGRLIQRVQDIREDVTRLITALMMINKRLEASEVQRNFRQLIDDIRSCVSEVFAEPITSEHVSRAGAENASICRDVPIVEPFKGSELLI